MLGCFIKQEEDKKKKKMQTIHFVTSTFTEFLPSWAVYKVNKGEKKKEKKKNVKSTTVTSKA